MNHSNRNHPLKSSVITFMDMHGDQEVWLAQGIEYDICAQADTRELAIKSFYEIIEHQELLDKEDGIEPFSNIPELPAYALMQILPDQ